MWQVLLKVGGRKKRLIKDRLPCLVTKFDNNKTAEIHPPASLLLKVERCASAMKRFKLSLFESCQIFIHCAIVFEWMNEKKNWSIGLISNWITIGTCFTCRPNSATSRLNSIFDLA